MRHADGDRLQLGGLAGAARGHGRAAVELVDGELVVSPSPGYRHQRVVNLVQTDVTMWAREHGGQVLPGPFDAYLTEGNSCERDLIDVRRSGTSRLTSSSTRSDASPVASSPAPPVSMKVKRSASAGSGR